MQYVSATGPWFMTYRSGRAVGVMLDSGYRDIALSAAALGHGVVVGWRRAGHTFRDRKYVLGRE